MLSYGIGHALFHRRDPPIRRPTRSGRRANPLHSRKFRSVRSGSPVPPSRAGRCAAQRESLLAGRSTARPPRHRGHVRRATTLMQRLLAGLAIPRANAPDRQECGSRRLHLSLRPYGGTVPPADHAGADSWPHSAPMSASARPSRGGGRSSGFPLARAGPVTLESAPICPLPNIDFRPPNEVAGSFRWWRLRSSPEVREPFEYRRAYRIPAGWKTRSFASHGSPAHGSTFSSTREHSNPDSVSRRSAAEGPRRRIPTCRTASRCAPTRHPLPPAEAGPTRWMKLTTVCSAPPNFTWELAPRHKPRPRNPNRPKMCRCRADGWVVVFAPGPTEASPPLQKPGKPTLPPVTTRQGYTRALRRDRAAARDRAAQPRG